jgi:hypothetical protein
MLNGRPGPNPAPPAPPPDPVIGGEAPGVPGVPIRLPNVRPTGLGLLAEFDNPTGGLMALAPRLRWPSAAVATLTPFVLVAIAGCLDKFE